MSSEAKIISAILNRQDITTPLEKGVTENIFNDPASKKAFSWIFRYYLKFRYVPKKERFKRQFPNYRIVRVADDDPFEDICEEVLGNIRYRYVVESIREIAEMVDNEDPKVYDRFIKAGMELAGITVVGDLVKLRDMHFRIDQYEKDVAEGKNPMGIPFGIPSIDKATMGMQPGDLITIAARLGTGKSNLLKHVIKGAFLERKNVVVFSLEEHPKLFQRRLDAMINDLNYQDFKSLKLPKDEIKRWRDNSKKFFEEFENDVNVVTNIKRLGPEVVLSYIERFKPDLVAIDGMHLLRGSGGGYSVDWKQITSVIDEVKQIALYTDTPICGVVQANRAASKEGVNVDNLSFADSIGQLCDIVIGIWQDKQMEKKQVASLKLAKNRDGQKIEDIMCWWKLGPERIIIQEMTQKEIQENGIFDEEEED